MLRRYFRPDICHKDHELYSWRKNCLGEKFQFSMYDNFYFNLCRFIAKSVIYAVLSWNFCHNLRDFISRRIEPKSTFVEKRWQLSGLHYLGNTFTLLEQYWDTAWALLGQYQETILTTLWQYSGTSLTYVRFFPNSDLGPFIFCHTWHMYISEIYKDSKCQDREERQ